MRARNYPNTHEDIAASDIANIVSRLTTKPYITQEIYTVPGQPVVATEYTGNGK